MAEAAAPPPAAAAEVRFFFSTTGPFQGYTYREKGRKVQNYYILLFLKRNF
jgi:hypothetical protein